MAFVDRSVGGSIIESSRDAIKCLAGCITPALTIAISMPIGMIREPGHGAGSASRAVLNGTGGTGLGTTSDSWIGALVGSSFGGRIVQHVRGDAEQRVQRDRRQPFSSPVPKPGYAGRVLNNRLSTIDMGGFHRLLNMGLSSKPQPIGRPVLTRRSGDLTSGLISSILQAKRLVMGSIVFRLSHGLSSGPVSLLIPGSPRMVSTALTPWLATNGVWPVPAGNSFIIPAHKFTLPPMLVVNSARCHRLSSRSRYIT